MKFREITAGLDVMNSFAIMIKMVHLYTLSGRNFNTLAIYLLFGS